MQAAIFRRSTNDSGQYLQIEDIPRPTMLPGHSLLRVIACGVCRTDLHIVTGELPALRPELIPGHQIVGEIVDGATTDLPLGTRVGVSWMGGVDGTCWYCTHDAENLCDEPTFTGYTVDGGYAEFVLVRTDFLLPLPVGLDDAAAAPLLCAGIIGFRSLRVAGVQPREKVGLYGFGSSASLAIQVLQSWNCEVYVSSRGQGNRDRAAALGATWVGKDGDKPPVPLDRAITFAPSGEVVIAALGDLRKGGVVAVNAIHMDKIPAFDYDSLLWGERQIRSVANMTRADARDFLEIAHKLGIRPKTTVLKLEQANEALAMLSKDRDDSSIVLVP
jgi:alcohol dehydrogenase, propanol-preferring